MMLGSLCFANLEEKFVFPPFPRRKHLFLNKKGGIPMRNLKRALSLLLSSTMVLGMVVMGGSAAGYQDVDASNDNQEAIEVLQAVGIMSGVDDKGNFNPDGSLTRNEMAVVMAHLLNLDYDYYRGVNTFTDVPEWAAPYVAACVAEGVTAGVGNGLYGGDQKITAAQAGLMVMKALGYFQNQEDFGSDWQVATIRQASYINLFSNVNSDAESALTRGQVAQLVLNGLKAKMVDFTGDKGIQIGDVTVGYKAEYTARTNAAAKYNTIDDGTTNIAENDQYYVQLGEELYNGDLKLSSDVDIFGRPAHVWEYDGKEIGTYVNYDLLVKEYTTEVTGKDLYDLLGAATIKDYSLSVVIDGVSDSKVNTNVFTAADMNKNNDSKVGDTGNGVLTQVFVDTLDKDITISIINTYLAIADKDYDAKKDEVAITAYGVEKKNNEYIKILTSSENKSGFDLAGEDFDIADVVEDDALLVTVADGEVQTVAKAKVLSGVEITAFKKNSNVTVDGTKYSYSDTAEFEHGTLDNYTGETATINLKDATYNIYLDAYGYAIGVQEIDPADNYLFITGLDVEGSNLGNKTAKASAIFLDGTMKTIDVNLGKSTLAYVGDDTDAILNTWCTYTVNNENVYTVTEVISAGVTGSEDPTKVPGGSGNSGNIAQFQETHAGSSTWDIDKKNISLAGGATSGSFKNVYGNDSTVYLTAELAEIDNGATNSYGIIDGVASVTTGVKNANLKVWDKSLALTKAETTDISDTIVDANLSQGVYTLYKDNGYVIAAVVVGDDGAATKNLVYVSSSSVEQESYDKTTDEWTWTRKVVVNGEEVEIKEVSDGISMLSNMKQDFWYQVKYNADGEVIEVLDANKTNMDTEMLDILTGGSYTDTTFNQWDLTGDKYVNVITSVKSAVNNEDNVLYVQGFDASHPVLRGSTLFVSTTDTEGFFVTEDVNVVLRQYNKNKMTTTYETGVDALEDILEDLNTLNGTSYSYIVSAILEEGGATTVVIYDATNTYQRPEDPTDLTGMYVNLVTPASVDVVYNGTTPTAEQGLAAVVQSIKDAGYNIKKTTFDGTSEYTFEVSKTVSGLEIDQPNFVWDTSDITLGRALTVGGKQVMASNSSTNWDDVLTELGIAAGDQGTYGYVDGAASPVPLNSTAPSAGESLVYGYYKVTMASTKTDPNTQGLDYTVTNSAAVSYVKKNAVVNLVITVDGTSSGTTPVTFAVTNGSMTNVADLNPAAGGDETGMTSVAVTGNNTVTFTPAGSGTVDAVYTIPVTVTGAGDVSFS